MTIDAVHSSILAAWSALLLQATFANLNIACLCIAVLTHYIPFAQYDITEPVWRPLSAHLHAHGDSKVAPFTPPLLSCHSLRAIALFDRSPPTSHQAGYPQDPYPYKMRNVGTSITRTTNAPSSEPTAPTKKRASYHIFNYTIVLYPMRSQSDS